MIEDEIKECNLLLNKYKLQIENCTNNKHCLDLLKNFDKKINSLDYETKFILELNKSLYQLIFDSNDYYLDIILKFKWSLLYYCFQTEFYNYIYNNQYDKKISKKKLKIEFISKINQILLLSKLEFEHNKELLNDFNDMILIIIKPLEI